MVNYATNDITSEGLVDGVVSDTGIWLETGMTLAADAPAAIAAAVASLSTAQQQQLILWLALFAIIQAAKESQLLSGTSGALSPIGKVNIPGTGFAAPDNEEKGCTGLEQLNIDSVSFPPPSHYPVSVRIQDLGRPSKVLRFLSFGAMLRVLKYCRPKCMQDFSRILNIQELSILA